MPHSYHLKHTGDWVTANWNETMILHPSDNEFDIPCLPLSAQALEIHAPVIGWGSIGRTRQMPGTWHFYVDDAKFAGVLRDPSVALLSGCVALCEPNISVYDQTPRWEALAAIGRKRVVAAAWAARGARVLVDLNMPEKYLCEALLGVPHGWRAYSTRGYAARPEALRREYTVARERAGADPLLLVVGGGKPIREMCQCLPGAVHVDGNSPDSRSTEATGRGLHCGCKHE